MGGGGGDRGSGLIVKNHKNIGFSGNTGPDRLKNHSYQVSIQYWAIINWCFAGRLTMARVYSHLDPPSPHIKKNQNKKTVKVGPPLTKLPGSVHASMGESFQD